MRRLRQIADLRSASKARRGVATIAGGTAVGQIVALAAAPVLTRVYSPADFGLFAVLSALSVTLGTVAAARLDLAVPLPERDEDAYALAAGGLLACALSLSLGCLVVLTTGDRLASLLDQPGLMPWLWLMPVSAAFMAGSLVLNQLALRHQRFAAVARRNLVQAVALVATQVVLGLVGIRPGGLVVGFAVAQMLSLLSLLPGSRLLQPSAREGMRPSAIVRALARYRRFPLVATPSGLMNVLGPQLPVLFMSIWYGGQVAGWLGLTQRVLTLPVSLVGTAVAQVYLSELSRASLRDMSRARGLFDRVSVTLTVAASVLAVVLVLAGPALFAWFFGERWQPSGDYARALGVGVAAQLVSSPLSQTLVVFEKQINQLWWDIGRLTSMAAVLSLFPLMGAGALTTVWAVGVLTALTYAAAWDMSRRAIRTADARSQT